MADPIIVKVSALTELPAANLASGDLITVVDISESISSNKTKKLKAGSLKIFSGTQINSGTVITSHLAEKIVTTPKLGDNSVTEAKLGEIKRTAVIQVVHPLDYVEIISINNYFPWPVTLHNFNIIDARISLSTPSTSGNVQIELRNKGNQLCTLTLGVGQTGMSSSGVISESQKQVQVGSFLGVNVLQKGTGARGLFVTLVLEGVPA